MLTILEQIGSFLVLGQAAMVIPSLVRLVKDRDVQGMSVWTMGFYAFVSFYYIPIFYLTELYWTMYSLCLLGALELLWCVGAIVVKKVDRPE